MSVIESKPAKRTRIGPNLFERVGPQGATYHLIANVRGKQVCIKLRARTRTDARAERDRKMSELADGGLAAVGDRSVTLGALVQAFLAAPIKLSPNTIAQRRHMLTKHVLPILGERTRATDLTAGHVRRMIERLTKNGLSGASVNVCVKSLSVALDYGVRQEWLPRNVTRDLVRGDRPSAKRQTEPRYLKVDEVELLLRHLSDEFRPVAACAFWGGLRVSEILALRWEDIDFEQGRISIRAGKTKASVADVPLLPRLATELRAHRERQAALGFSRITSGSLVFQTFTGRPQSRRNALRAVNVASVRAGLVKGGQERVGVHDLRHSLAANAFALGLSPVEVSKLLRHANPQVTLTVYAGLAGDHVEVLASKLGKLAEVSS